MLLKSGVFSLWRSGCGPGLLVLLLAVGGSPLLAAGVPAYKSGPVQVTADGATVWVADRETDRVFRIDTATDAVTEHQLDPVARDVPLGVSVTEDGTTVWVAAHDTDRVYLLDGTTGAVQDQIDLPFGSGPYSVALSPPDGAGAQAWALVTLHRSEAVAVVDTTSLETTILEPVFTTPFGITWIEGEEAAWVTHLMVAGEHPQLTRVDVSGGDPRVTTRLEIGRANPITTPSFPTELAEGGYLNWRGHPAQVPDALTGGPRQLWIPTQYSNMNGDQPSVDTTIQSSLRKLDLDTRAVTPDDKVVLTAVDVHDPVGNNAWQGHGWDAGVSGPVDLAFARLNGSVFALALHEQSNDLIVLPWDSAPWRSQTDPNAPRLPEVGVGDRPMGLAVSPVADVAWVYNALSSDVSVLDLADPTNPGEVRRIPFPTRVDPTDPFVKGAKLFHTSDDPRISVNEKVACASCHINAEHDGRTWAFEHLPAGTAGQGHGPRSTINLRDLSLTSSPGQRDPDYDWGQLHHSGDRDEVQDFEHTFLGIQMGGQGFIPSANLQPELGSPNAGQDPTVPGSSTGHLDDIATYLRALEPLERSPHRAADGSLTEAARRGAAMFLGTDTAGHPADAGCVSCHVPETGFVDYRFHDVGQRRAGAENELNNRTPAWHVNTLTLVGAWNTPPYDGILSFAHELVGALKDFGDMSYGRTVPHGSTAGLTRRQIADLAELVLSVDGDLASDPSELRSAVDDVAPRIVRVEPASLDHVTVWFDETVDAASATVHGNWALERLDTGEVFTPAATLWDNVNGDRVDLGFDPPLVPDPAGIDYVLRPVGPIFDVADQASPNASANALDPADPTNHLGFTLTDVLTITLGASGKENVDITVHDSAPVGPGLSTWVHDRVQVSHLNGNRVPGFVRFDWRDPFATAAGAGSWTPASADILDARFSLFGELGDAQSLELRRVLQPWSDANSCVFNGVTLTNSDVCADWNRNADGAPSWRDHRHPNDRWNQAGARAMQNGIDGTDPSHYGGSFDLADPPDAVLGMRAVNERTEYADPKITEAFRFWYDNPGVDYGYALRLNAAPPANPVVRFERWEAGLHDHGPVLTLTYKVPPPVPEISGEPGGGGPGRVPLLVSKDPANPNDDLVLAFEDRSAEADLFNLYEGDLGGAFSSHVPAGGPATGCHRTPGQVGSLLSLSHTTPFGSGSRYFLVTGSNAYMEGSLGVDSSGFERDPSRRVCGRI